LSPKEHKKPMIECLFPVVYILTEIAMKRGIDQGYMSPRKDSWKLDICPSAPTKADPHLTYLVGWQKYCLQCAIANSAKINMKLVSFTNFMLTKTKRPRHVAAFML
jgi:hypothetical protein